MAPDTASVATFADNKDTYQAALQSLFSGNPESTESELSKLLTPSFTLKEHDEILDFPAFVSHIRHLRQILKGVVLTSTQFLRDGNQLAERHIGITTGLDGSVYRSETLQFAEIAPDGRIAWIVELVDRGR